MHVERRRYKRYPAAGQVEFGTRFMTATGDLLDIGEGGVLIHSPIVPFPKRNITIRFAVPGYPLLSEAKGKVVHTQRHTQSVKFLRKPPGLKKLLRWLERF